MTFAFEAALKKLKDGRRVARAGWNGRGMWLQLVQDWETSDPAIVRVRVDGKLTQNAPFIAMKTADNMLVPWLCSQTDMLAEDWELVR